MTFETPSTCLIAQHTHFNSEHTCPQVDGLPPKNRYTLSMLRRKEKMFKILERYLKSLFRGWDKLIEQVPARVKEQVLLTMTIALLQQANFIVWALVLYVFMNSK